MNLLEESWQQRERLSAVYGTRDSEQVPGPSNPELNIPEYMRSPPSFQGKGAWSDYKRYSEETAVDAVALQAACVSHCDLDTRSAWRAASRASAYDETVLLSTLQAMDEEEDEPKDMKKEMVGTPEL